MAINKTASLVFTGTRRFWNVPDIIETGTITYSISGGGGGTGGNDAQIGRSGSSAGYVRGTFTIAAGQTINVGVGGAGGNGTSVAANAVGGSGGQSLTGFSGGFGGKSGQFGTSGAGGGGGGATVIKIGETLIAVAAGGGGGGGGGLNSSGGFGGAGKNVDNFLGQNGAPHNGDGGGGGGGGGGWTAGAGGEVVNGDVGGNPGYQGTSAGLNSTVVTVVENTTKTIDTRVTTTTAGYSGGVVFDSADLARLGAAAGAADHYRSQNSAYGAFLNAHGVWADTSVPAIPYEGSLLNVPFYWGNALRYFIAPNTSGYYIHTFGRENEFGGATVTIAGYSVVINGHVVYASFDIGNIAAVAPPENLYTKGSFVGYSAEIYYEGPFAFTRVECYNFTDVTKYKDGNTYLRNWLVNFPVSGNYLFQAAWDNAGRIMVEAVPMVERFTGDDPATFQTVTEATKYIEAGFRNIGMYAENYGGPASIGCVITGLPVAATTTTTGEIITTGSISTRNQGVGPGVSGYADMYLYASLKRGIQVKVNGQWTTAKDIYTKISGAWKKTSQVYVKIDGEWKQAFIRGGDNLIRFEFSSTSDGFGDSTGAAASGTSVGGEPPPPPPPADTGGGGDGGGYGIGDGGGGAGGGGGCKIICTKLHELGYLPDHIYAADEKFGEWLRETDPYAYYGYVKWASVVVDWMDKDGPQCMFWIRDKQKRNDTQRAMAISWARKIATPWAQHMAFLMGVEKEDNKAGRLIMKTGMWVSRMIGKYTKTTEPTKSPVLGYVMWATFGVFWLLAGVK